MKNKLRAIWRIIRASEYFVYADSGVTASHREKDTHSIIVTFCDAIKRAEKPAIKHNLEVE